MGLTKAELKYLNSLQNKKGRRQENRFLADGVRLLEEALKARYRPLSIMYSPSDLNERGEALVKAFVDSKITARSISARECQSLSDTKTSQGIVGLFECKKYSLEQQLDKGHRKILVGDGIADPGNLGTLIRAAVAFDFGLVLTTAGSAEAVNPKTVRASMGGYFRIPVIEGVEDAGLAAQLKKRGYSIYEADLKGKDISRTTPISAKAVLVIGSEATGAGEQLTRRADYRIKIPMSRHAESLNSAMAGTVLMFWINSQERAKS
jgi:TrmH family RNA methyltransferase